MENKQKGFLSRIFSTRAGKGAGVGAAVALGIGLTPLAPVSVPVILAGAAIGAIWNSRNP